MSYDFAIWEGDAPTSGHNAAATFKALFSHYLEGALVAPTEKIQLYSEALAAHFPDHESDDGVVAITTSQGRAAIPERWPLFLSQELRDIGNYVIVDTARDDYFAQARNDDGTFSLEYRDGSPQQHYQVQGVDLGDVTEALSQWSEHRRDFITNHTWQRLTLWD
ncbi:hypothetical protein OHA70_25665 [Kribbella sp. NBC_00382]|uniref:hypothetical protein n=1 Tax=Kribbella sp. NBC_00382 TaxID=2975967 RepID=UPI002E24CB00